MCNQSHRYTVEVIGQPARYAGTDADEAVSAMLTIDSDGDEEGYVVAEHVKGDATVYCPAESDRLEVTAMLADAIDVLGACRNELPHVA